MAVVQQLLTSEWLWWLSAPALTTSAAALWVWWRGRPERSASSEKSVQGHRAYLDALERTALPDRRRR